MKKQNQKTYWLVTTAYQSKVGQIVETYAFETNGPIWKPEKLGLHLNVLFAMELTRKQYDFYTTK